MESELTGGCSLKQLNNGERVGARCSDESDLGNESGLEG